MWKILRRSTTQKLDLAENSIYQNKVCPFCHSHISMITHANFFVLQRSCHNGSNNILQWAFLNFLIDIGNTPFWPFKCFFDYLQHNAKFSIQKKVSIWQNVSNFSNKSVHHCICKCFCPITSPCGYCNLDIRYERGTLYHTT